MKFLQNPIVVGVLALLALLLVFRNALGPAWESFRSKPKPARPAAAAPAQASGAATAEASARPDSGATEAAGFPMKNINLLLVASRADKWIETPLWDPFRSLALSTNHIPAADLLSLKAVWRQTGSNLAVVNGRVLGEGDAIEGFTIRRIERDQIWVEGLAGRESLRFSALAPEDVKEEEFAVTIHIEGERD